MRSAKELVLAAAATFVTTYGAELMVLAWVALIAAHIFALLHFRRRRLAATPSRNSPPRSDKVALASAPKDRQPSEIAAGVQVERLFAYVEHATASAERAMAAHTAAAKHLDSAEYQLLRLFEEFPMLAPERARRSLASAVAVPAGAVHPQALAA